MHILLSRWMKWNQRKRPEYELMADSRFFCILTTGIVKCIEKGIQSLMANPQGIIHWAIFDRDGVERWNNFNGLMIYSFIYSLIRC